MSLPICSGKGFELTRGIVTYQWTRIIDSTGVLDPDEATWDWDKLGNGDAFEAGTAVCPSRNDELTSYEEIWRNITRKGPLTSSWILQSEEGTTFLGLVGGTFLGIRSNSDGSFGARREEWDPEQRSWSFKLERGHCVGIPEVEAVLKDLPAQLSAENLRVGATVSVAGVNYAVRAVEDSRTVQ